ncbi:Nitrite reductase (cytochrome; ammonia-forming) [Anaeromyxobacter dehalogenans 2CP-1]|uniref:nitrite reductase (cytochrome; ammonia-forming) n=1 Tax=Anaeromyxobacter dehalogenans (strain ATCC BAA-258 / DSM 21875 / 2CP-1) TaxID=455488 RepID=B8JG24_ANAD2|nr:ammonia-forming cytochrome c nitrite reductase subunit c552 [Anaeromyxobacter dehalogenans]ACL66427.1 Nitrite reductase (cytochrome; ammonia-forming) [Anaeromyxobacter dehalogenans 2CP-1]
MPAETQPTKNRALLIALVAGVFALVAVGVAMLLVNISEKKSEARFSYVRVVEVGEDDTDPAKWGKNWPREFDDYKRTAERTSTKYGGAIGTAEGEMAPQKAERDPWLKRVFAGYLFAVDYRDRRGHAFMLKDQEITKRNIPGEGKQSGNCLHCHGSIMPLYRKLGKEAAPQGSPAEQLQAGLAKVAEMGYWDAHKALEEMGGGKAHPVSCVDCHDPASMEVRVSRPGFIAGIQKLAAGSAEVPHLPSIDRWRKGDRSKPYDPNLDSTRQERRAYVCGQCHVEYFCGKGMTLLFPWAEGLKVENAEHLYDNLQVKGQRFKDWVHAETGFEVLKAQHPEFEVWSQGIHARSGVTCADCHMPYKREGAQKYSDHWVRSPLLQPNRACATCHPLTDDELKARVLGIQDRHFALLTRAGNAAVAMIDAIVTVRKPYDERNLAAATAKAKDTLGKQDAFQKAPKEEQDKKLAAEVKANLLASWREVIAKTPALQELEKLQRAAQWRLDFVAAENSMGFHAPQELARILGESIDLSREAEVKATRLAAGTTASAAAVPASQPGR